MGIFGKFLGITGVTAASVVGVTSFLNNPKRKLKELDREFEEYRKTYKEKREPLIKKANKGNIKAEEKLKAIESDFQRRKEEYEQERKELIAKMKKPEKEIETQEKREDKAIDHNYEMEKRGLNHIMEMEKLERTQSMFVQHETAVTEVPPPIPKTVYHIALGGKSSGPYELSVVCDMIAKGQVTKETLVWKTGAPNWEKANTLEELKGYFPPDIPTT